MMNEADTRADMLSRGYVPIEASPNDDLKTKLAARGLVVGARVCNDGQRYFEARDHGTAVVVEVFHKVRSSWEHSYGRPDVEVLVERDKETFGTKVGLWSDYGTHVAYNQPAEVS